MHVLLEFIHRDRIGLIYQGAIAHDAGQFRAASNIVVVCRAVSCSLEICKELEVGQQAFVDG